MRIALFGDVGGHARLLADALAALGADVDAGVLPADLVVVQAGDLIDRGPDSAGCVALADRFLQGSPRGWVQVLGNHEGNRLGGPRFWEEPLDDAAVATLARWWTQRRARLAVAVRTVEEGDLLVTHGGLTATLWTMLGKPELCESVARIERWVGREPALAFSAGAMLGGGGVAGPAWAEAGTELYGSWFGRPAAPFGQVHGHSSIVAWPKGNLVRGLPRWLERAAVVDPAHRRVRTPIGGRPFIGIDPTFGVDAGDACLHPLLLHGEVLDA